MLVKACLVMQPRLEAREALLAVNRQMVAGARVGDAADAGRQIAAWEHISEGQAPPVALPPGATRKAAQPVSASHLARMAARGMGIRAVPGKASAHD